MFLWEKAYNAINACCKYAVATHKIQYDPVSAVEIPISRNFEIKEIFLVQ